MQHIKFLAVFLFSIAMSDHAGNMATVAATRKTEHTETKNTHTPATAIEAKSLSPAAFGRIDSIVNTSIRQRVFPGCQVLVLKNGQPVYDKCFGNFTYEGGQKVQPGTMYDLASLSKTTGTLLAVMKLYDMGKLRVEDKASHYLTFLRGTDKENISIRELLVHESGLPAGLPFHQLTIEKKGNPACMEPTRLPVPGLNTDNRVSGPSLRYKTDFASKIPFPDFNLQVSDSFYLNRKFHDEAMRMIARTRLHSKTYEYSCVNFIILKEIAETISGMRLDEFLDSLFYAPMK
ncbi:MAG TPA: serine hydrolase domain-containing protein, partial [Paludibacter sp.]|nr:serine hydrolase domain-containing protein [Paludibacter sp.]